LKKKDTKTKIIHAAFEVFSKKGYNSTTTKELAKKAGVNEVTLFRLFKKKENLYKEMLAYYANIEFIADQVHFEIKGDTRKDLRNILEEMITTIPVRNKIIKLIMLDAHTNPIVKKRLTEFPMGLQKFFKEYLQTVIPEESARDIDYDIASLILLSYILRYSILESMIGRDPFGANEDENIDRFLDIFLHGILKPAGTQGGD
jgi:AcrR family transcriptional regulator